jgi:hypothetical protein
MQRRSTGLGRLERCGARHVTAVMLVDARVNVWELRA